MASVVDLPEMPGRLSDNCRGVATYSPVKGMASIYYRVLSKQDERRLPIWF